MTRTILWDCYVVPPTVAKTDQQTLVISGVTNLRELNTDIHGTPIKNYAMENVLVEWIAL